MEPAAAAGAAAVNTEPPVRSLAADPAPHLRRASQQSTQVDPTKTPPPALRGALASLSQEGPRPAASLLFQEPAVAAFPVAADLEPDEPAAASSPDLDLCAALRPVAAASCSPAPPACSRRRAANLARAAEEAAAAAAVSAQLAARAEEDSRAAAALAVARRRTCPACAASFSPSARQPRPCSALGSDIALPLA